MLVNCCNASNASDFLNIYQQLRCIFGDVKWSDIIVLFVMEYRQREFEFHTQVLECSWLLLYPVFFRAPDS